MPRRRCKEPLIKRIIRSKKFKIDKNVSEGSQEEETKSKRRTRMNFSEAQIGFLEEVFLDTHYPDVFVKKEIAEHLNIPIDRITVWFQNRRSKHRREKVQELKNSKSKIASEKK